MPEGAMVLVDAIVLEGDTQSAAGMIVGAATIGGGVGAIALVRDSESAAWAVDEVEPVIVAIAAGLSDAEPTAGTEDKTESVFDAIGIVDG